MSVENSSMNTFCENIMEDTRMTGSQPSEPPLPPGWIVCKSKKFSDRVYFFNVDTGQSLWEPPDFQSPLLVK